jgi:hypothetical protein
MPESWAMKVAPSRLGYAADDIPGPVSIADGDVRLLIAPANYAGQGHAWARSAARLAGVSAVNLTVARTGDFGFLSDFTVPGPVFRWSQRWSRAHLDVLRERFSHVVIEAERSMLGVVHDHDLRREAAWLDGAGIARAYASHGSDLRLPSRHAALDPWSPFRDREWPLLETLERNAARNAAFLAEQGRPVFVPTPELLLDVADARWLPIVVDPSSWRLDTLPLQRRRPVVVHAPTSPQLKGTHLVEPTLRRLHDEGVISYRPVSGIPHRDMLALYASADVVLEQFRLGNYATTAIEAMAAGRLVIGHVSDQVRDVVRSSTGRELPVVEADPSALEAVLRDVAARPDEYAARAAGGPAFVDAVHDGRHSAEVLARFLSSPSGAGYDRPMRNEEGS